MINKKAKEKYSYYLSLDSRNPCLYINKDDFPDTIYICY